MISRLLHLFYLIIFLPGFAEAHGGYITFGVASGGEEMSDAITAVPISVKAGSSISLRGGPIFQLAGSDIQNFELQSGVGIEYNSGGGDSDNNTNWVRVPLELFYFYRYDGQFRVGLGYTYRIFNRLKATGKYEAAQTDFDNAPGFSLAAEKIWYANPTLNWTELGIGLRFDQVTYSSHCYSKTLNGSSVTLTITEAVF